MTQFHHGITAREALIGKIPLRNADTNTIAMLAFADDADENIFPLNTPVLVTSINRVLSKAGTQGNLRKNLEIISAITSPTLVVIRIDNPFGDGFDQSQVIGTTNEDGKRTGLQALLTVKSVLGITPKIICVSDTESIDVANALGAICKKLRAYSYITPRNADGEILQNAEAVSAYREMLAFREIELIWPEWTSGNVFSGVEKPIDAISVGISPDLQYSTEDGETRIYWAIEVNGTLYPTEIGGNEEYPFLEDYLQENKETLGITGEYIDNDDDSSAVYMRSITNTRKFVRLIPDKPYKNDMKFIGNPTAKIDSEGVISFWLEANNEVIEPEPEPEPEPKVCDCEQSWVLIPDLTPSVTIGHYDDVFFFLKNHIGISATSYSESTPVIDLLRDCLNTSDISPYVELVRCDENGTILRNISDECISFYFWARMRDGVGNVEYILNSGEIDLCAYDASEVIPEPIPKDWDIEYVLDGQTFREKTGSYINDALKAYTQITSLIINSTVETVGSAAFENCKLLTNLVLLDGIKELKLQAFNECSSLRSFSLPSSIESIGSSIFRDCSSLERVSIPDSVNIIGSYAFQNCTSLESASVGNGVKVVESQIFRECSALKTVTLGNNVERITMDSFYDCPVLDNITLPTAVPPVIFPGGVMGGYAHLKFYVPADAVGAYQMAAEWSEIADNIFAIP